MCDCCVPQTVLNKIVEPSVWFPVATGIIAYFVQLWIRTARKRREDSAIAAIYLHEIIKEIEIGIERLAYLYTHAGQPYMSGKYRPIMPTQNWTGVRDIFPDDVFRRLNNVAKHNGKMADYEDMRYHLKNYYTVVCKFGNDAIQGNGPFDRKTARVDLDGARGVCEQLKSAKKLMEKNSKRIVWPW